MKKVTKRSSGSKITVTIARLGEDEIELSVGKDATVGEIVEEAGLELSSSEKMYVNSDEAEDHYVVDDGDHIAVIGKKEGAEGAEGAEESDEGTDEDAPAE